MIDKFLTELQEHLNNEYSKDEIMLIRWDELINYHSKYILLKYLDKYPQLLKIFKDGEDIHYIPEADFTIRWTEKGAYNPDLSLGDNYGYLKRCLKGIRYQFIPSVSHAEYLSWLNDIISQGDLSRLEISEIMELITYEGSIKRFSIVK